MLECFVKALFLTSVFFLTEIYTNTLFAENPQEFPTNAEEPPQPIESLDPQTPGCEYADNAILLSETPQPENKKELVAFYDNGFYFSGDCSSLRIGGWAQIDYRDFLGKHPSKDTFLIRRAQIEFGGILVNDFAYALYIRALRDTARLQEAWLEYRKLCSATIRIGLFKLPFSLEETYSSRWIYFVERSIVVTNLAPFNDIGIKLYGRIFYDKIVYAIAAFHERNNDTFFTVNGKGFAGRLTFQPFNGCCDSRLGHLFFGGSFTAAHIDNSVDNIRYLTAARTTFLRFNSNDFEDGHQYRGGLEAQWFNGPFVFNSEYIVSKRNRVFDKDSKATVSSHGWYASASYLLTGETQPRNGPVQPCYLFDPWRGGWGAWEIGFRYEQFRTNALPFELGLVSGVQFVSAVTAGITWWPNEHIKFVGNFVYTDFHDKLIVRQTSLNHETTLLFRAQFSF